MSLKIEKDVIEFVRDAYEAGRKLRIVGGGTRQALGNPCESNAVLSTADLSGISLYEPSALTVVAAAGTPLADIEKTLAAEGQRLPFEPMDHRGLLASTGTPTIGSVVACNISGPARIQAGACRDSLIGVRLVDGTGRVIKNGGRVMKNVTGYDLVKLMAGSFGTLGVLTEVAFKVLPAPVASATVSVAGLSDEQAVEAMSLGLTAPYDVNGAAHMGAVTILRVEGFKASVAYRAEQLKTLLAPLGKVSIINDDPAWKSVRDVKPFHGLDTDVWRISVAPSDGPKVAAALREMDDSVQVIYDWGGGLIWASTPAGTNVRNALSGILGYAECIRGKGQKRVPQNTAIARIEQGLRAKFDPKNILNAGIMG
ncbi:MAG: FAD-binding protein [Amylibacter sp.]|nr:FAD-binding protein [Amylibacter sp.]